MNVRFPACIATIALALGGCGSDPASPPSPSLSQSGGDAKVSAPAPSGAETQPSPPAASGRAWRYTSTAACKIVREERAEMPFVETLCTGPAGYQLRVADSDARQSVAVVAADGSETPLGLSRIGGGGFSTVGTTAEWRGPSGEPFAPDSLIVRYRVTERPHPAPDVAYLVAVRLGRTPCVAATIPPGPDQNALARTAADDPEGCMAG